jgi:hypothetical protein
MNKMMEKMMAMKKAKEMSPSEKNAKMSVLHDLKKQAQDAMGGKLDGMKKVSVMSDSPEGLQHGLDKAKELTQNMPDESEDSDEQMMSEGGFAKDATGQEDDEGAYGKSHEASPYDKAGDTREEEEQFHEESPAEESNEMSPEEIDAKIQHLMDLKKKKMHHQG